MSLPLNPNHSSQRLEKFCVDLRGIWLDFVLFKDQLFTYIYISFQTSSRGKSKLKFVFCLGSIPLGIHSHFHIHFRCIQEENKMCWDKQGHPLFVSANSQNFVITI